VSVSSRPERGIFSRRLFYTVGDSQRLVVNAQHQYVQRRQSRSLVRSHGRESDVV